ncbi:MAG: hypothetical protein R2939_22495 [Kofleriaceae bacterium]
MELEAIEMVRMENLLDLTMRGSHPANQPTTVDVVFSRNTSPSPAAA